MKPSRLQSRFLVFAIASVAALQMSPGVAAGGPGMGSRESRTLTVVKDCNTTSQPGELQYCTITESNVRALRGAKVRYFGPGFFTDDHPYLDSWVMVESNQGGGGTAFGHCLVRGVPSALGACQFTGGSGSLRGFQADVTVTTVGNNIWHLDGAFSIND